MTESFLLADAILRRALRLAFGQEVLILWLDVEWDPERDGNRRRNYQVLGQTLFNGETRDLSGKIVLEMKDESSWRNSDTMGRLTINGWEYLLKGKLVAGVTSQVDLEKCSVL